MPANHQDTRTFSGSRAEIVRACESAVTQAGLRTTASNPETGQIEARSKMGMRSWGEIITINVDAEGAVHIDSRCRGVQMVDYGKNRANIEKIFSALELLIPARP